MKTITLQVSMSVAQLVHCTKAPAELTNGIQPLHTKPYNLALGETVLYVILSPGEDIIHLDRP